VGGGEPLTDPVLVVAVLVGAIATALATGLGAVPLAILRDPGPRTLALADAVAAGVMAAAGVGLASEGLRTGVGRTVVGAVLGLLLIVAVRRMLPSGDGVVLAGLSGESATRALMVVGVMTAHSFAEGVAVGVAFGGEEAFGWAITLAIAIHNIPEGLAISLVLVPRGATVWSAAKWSVVSSLPQPVMAVPAFVFVSVFAVALPVGLGFAAGAMLWMVAAELVPDALRGARPLPVATAGGIAFVAMTLLGLAIVDV
jgi:zinc transporter ZupT